MAGMENIYDILAKENEESRQAGIDYSKIREGGVAAAVMAQAGGMLGGSVMQAAGFKTAGQKTQEGREKLQQMHPNPTTYQDMVAMANDAKNLGLSGDWELIMKRAEAMNTTAKAPPVFEAKINKINLLDIPQAEKDAMIKKVLSGNGGTTINMGAGDTAYDKEAGKIAAKTDKDLVDLATITATASLDKTGEVLDILETGEASTGMFAGLDLVKNRFLSVFGNEEARKSATKTQVLEAFLGSDVFPMIKALGIGARGLDTPAEREFLINVMTGAKEMNKEAIIKLTELRRSINESVVEKYNKRLADGGLDRFQKAYGRPLEPIKLKFRPPSSAISGVINGTKVFKLTNGEYVDAYGKPFKLNKGK